MRQPWWLQSIAQLGVPGMSWKLQPSAADLSWRGIAYSPALNRYVAVASTGTANQFMSSDDGGETWVSRTSPASSQNWRRVAWSPALNLVAACAVSGTNRIVTSPDGITWTARVNATGGNAMVWSPGLGLFVAAQSGANAITTSPDGINWTARVTPNATNRTGICWSASLGLLVVVGNSGTAAERVLTSPDGIVWTARTAASDAGWLSVDSDASGRLVAIAGSGVGNRMMTSVNGTVWSLVQSAADASAWQNVYYAPTLGTWHAVAQSGTVRAQISSDGLTWRAVAVPSAIQWYNLTGNASRLVAIGASGTGFRVMTSGPV
jgi:hypothetical protein